MAYTIEHYISTLDLESPYLDDVWGNTDPEEWEEIADNGFIEYIFPNVPEVISRLKDSEISAKGTNWIALVMVNPSDEWYKEKKDIFDYVNEKYIVLSCYSHNITIDYFRQ